MLCLRDQLIMFVIFETLRADILIIMGSTKYKILNVVWTVSVMFIIITKAKVTIILVCSKTRAS